MKLTFLDGPPTSALCEIKERQRSVMGAERDIPKPALINSSGLGTLTDIFSAGAGLISSFVDARADRKSDESDERQLQLQLQAQREMAQLDAARSQQTLKITLIAGGVLLAGGVIFAIVRSENESGVGNLESEKKFSRKNRTKK